jgi:hypothetical protein
MKGVEMSESDTTRVTVTDFDMPFLSMVRFMVKWAIAAIPAIFIITLAASLFWGIIFGAISTIGAALSRRSPAQETPQLSVPDMPAATPARSPDNEATKAYLDRVVVSGVHVARSVLGQTGVFGEIKNTGDHALKEVEITIYCLGREGKPIFETTYHPVLVTDMSFGDDAKPLKPGYSRTFGVKMDDAPSEWTKKVDVRVTAVEFQ